MLKLYLYRDRNDIIYLMDGVKEVYIFPKVNEIEQQEVKPTYIKATVQLLHH